jgi:hypothetical protein
LSKSKRLDLELEHYVDDAIKFWISHGADGIFLDGLEIFDVNVWVAQKISYWHGLLDRYSSKGLDPSHPRILMTSYKFAKELTDNVDDKKAVEEALEKIDLLDAHLDLDLKTNITHLEEDMGEITHWDALAQWVILPQKSLTVYFASFICPERFISSTSHQLVSMAIPVVKFSRRDTKLKRFLAKN